MPGCMTTSGLCHRTTRSAAVGFGIFNRRKIPSGTSLSCQSLGLNGVNITFTYYSVQVQRVQQPPVNTCNRERP